MLFWNRPLDSWQTAGGQTGGTTKPHIRSDWLQGGRNSLKAGEGLLPDGVGWHLELCSGEKIGAGGNGGQTSW